MSRICCVTPVVSSHGSHTSNLNSSMARSMSKPLYVANRLDLQFLKFILTDRFVLGYGACLPTVAAIIQVVEDGETSPAKHLLGE